MKNVIQFVVLGLLSLQLYAQGEANIWYFGNKAGLDFNSGSPVALTDGQMVTVEGCAAISNTLGQLLFYTNGITVWNKNHQIMPNGNGLSGDFSSTQSAIIVPKPNSTTSYYIFTVGELGNSDGLQYSIIDMALDNGLGDVTLSKNIFLQAPVCEKLTAVQNTAGDGYWIVTHGYGNNSFYAYSITATGLATTPVISNVGSIIKDNKRYTVGYLKFSPDGTKVISCNYQVNIELFDFDAVTGIISNPRLVSNKLANYGVEFSPSGKIAYVTEGDKFEKTQLNQYDLTDTNIPNTETRLYDGLSFKDEMGGLQLAINGKIYVSNIDKYYLSVINNPDVLGFGCDFQYNKINLGSGISNLGLPQFIQSYFNASFTAQNLCLGSSTEFNLTASSAPSSILWDFGDGTTSTAINPSHQYANPGKYTVSVNATSVSGKTNKSKEITISAIPFIANAIKNQSVCGNANRSYDLSQHNATVLGSQSASIFGVAYFSSQDDANKHTNLLSNTFALPLGVSTIYAKVYNLLNTSCNATTSFTATLNQQPIANPVMDYVICEKLPYDKVEQFDLASKNNQALGTQNASDYTVTYHKSLNDANSDTNPLPLVYTNTNPEETLAVRIENKMNPNCFATTSLNIKVIQQPQITVLKEYKVCDDATNDGIANFDVTQKTTEILNGQSPSIFEVKYYYSQANAQDNVNEITSPIKNTTNNQDIYYTISAIGNTNCKVVSSFKLVVTSLPIATTASVIYSCDDATNDGIRMFNLQNNTATILGNQNPSDFTVSFYKDSNEANTKSNSLPLMYQNTSNPQTIFARVENNQNSSCFTTTSFEIGLNKMPTANTVQNLITCDDDSNDGKETFDLETQNTIVLGTQLTTDFVITYHQSLTAATAGTNPLTNTYTNTVNPQTIYARIANTLSGSCFATTSFNVQVMKKPELTINDNYTICESKSITITAPAGFSSYSWSNDAKTPKTTIKEAGTYALTITQDYKDITCETTKVIVVANSNIATITKIETQDWTNSENTIAVYATGDGDYEYAIDGMNYQDNPQFIGLNNGQYKIYVRDKKGCGVKTEEVFLLMYPKYFTPNGDGFNDTWQIKYSNSEPKMKLTIYNRYGKIINSFKSMNSGWDGRLSGELLPSDDYWFVVQRENGKEYKGHFAMKR